MLKKIISGGQTGADRAALDVAIKMGIPHGGNVPKGRLAEDGPIPARYHLQEMPSDSYEARTEQNVIDSDGTLILSHGKLSGGTDYTREMTLKHKKQLLGIDLNLTGRFDAASLIASWIRMQKIEILNIAGPRASEDPQIYSDTFRVLEHTIQISNQENSKSRIQLDLPQGDTSLQPPQTVNESVERLCAKLTLKDKTLIANMAEVELSVLRNTLGEYIQKEFVLGSGNQDLMRSCYFLIKKKKISKGQAAEIIIRELWKRLRDSHKLRIIK
jgi:hypothetical protein